MDMVTFNLTYFKVVPNDYQKDYKFNNKVEFVSLMQIYFKVDLVIRPYYCPEMKTNI